MKLYTLAVALAAPLLILNAQAPVPADTTAPTAAAAPRAAQSPSPGGPTIDCTQRLAEDFTPETRTDRLAEYIRDLAGPQAFLYAGARAGLGQLRNRPREWRQGSVGYGRRFGDAMAQQIITATLQDGFALGLHEDNRYFSSGRHGIARLGYSLSSAFLARHDDGSRSLSWSTLGGVGGSSVIAQFWQPRSTAPMSNAGVAFAMTMGFRMIVNTVREFAPRPIGGLLR